mmetsp:Transcript_25543/g.101801  ORF Transcript_25543/g.101801 Transcript_25543/m.101801 type:complete len:237 (-) Transcript_25543:610-1320(-)
MMVRDAVVGVRGTALGRERREVVLGPGRRRRPAALRRRAAPRVVVDVVVDRRQTRRRRARGGQQGLRLGRARRRFTSVEDAPVVRAARDASVILEDGVAQALPARAVGARVVDGAPRVAREGRGEVARARAVRLDSTCGDPRRRRRERRLAPQLLVGGEGIFAPRLLGFGVRDAQPRLGVADRAARLVFGGVRVSQKTARRLLGDASELRVARERLGQPAHGLARGIERVDGARER